jgi:hypothetical protein
MPLTDPRETLGFHLARPLVRPRDLGHVPLARTTGQVRAFMAADDTPNTPPEAEALWFYAMNHGMAEIQKHHAPLEPLGPARAFVEAYHQALAPRAVRAFYYLLLICGRESRHLHAVNNVHGQLASQFGDAIAAFNQEIKGKNSIAAYERLLSDPPPSTIGTFCRSLRFVFYQGKFGAGYGGPAWGAIADCLCRFVDGEYSAEMMLDTIWTLSHNNGAIFNKGMLYGQHGSRLMRILDVQRSGQIPTMVLHDPQVAGFVAPELRLWMLWLEEHYPAAVRPYVDWFAVEALGGIHQYPKEKAEQVKAHGQSPEAAKQAAAAAELAKAKAAAEAKAAAAHQQKHFQVMPGLEVEKIQRQQAA